MSPTSVGDSTYPANCLTRQLGECTLSRFLAIDADAAGLFVVSATVKGTAVHLEQTLASSEDERPLTMLNAVALGAKLKGLLKQSGMKPAPVLLLIGRDRVILKDVRYPKVAPSEEPTLVKFQAIRDLTESPDDVVMDYIPSASLSPDGDNRAQAVFIRKEIQTAAKQFCEAAGLKLLGITPRPFALSASVRHAFQTGATTRPDEPSAAIAVVSVWDRGGEFTVCRGTEVLFAKTVPPNAVTNDASLIGELKRNITVYNSQPNATPLQAVYLAEGDTPAGWTARLRAALTLPVYAFDPLAGLPAADQTPPSLHARFAAPVGVLASRAAHAVLPINFVVPRQPRADTGPKRTRVLIGALAALIFVGLLGFLAFMKFDNANARLTRLRLQQTSLDDDLKRYETDVKRLAAVDEFTKREIVWLDDLYDLADRVPDVSKINITEYDGTALPPVKAVIRPGQVAAPVVKDPKPVPVANVRISMRTGDPQQAQRVVDAFKNDKYYTGMLKTTGGQGDSTTKGQVYVLTGQVSHRPPSDYVRRLLVTPPVKPKTDAEGDDIFGGFGGGN